MPLHCLYELNEITRIGFVIFRTEPAAVPCVAVGIRILHPDRTGPGRGHDFQVGIDGQDFLQNRNHIVQLVALEGEILNIVALGALDVAQRIVPACEIAGSDTDADIRHAVAVGGRECAAQQRLAGSLRHLQQVIACRVGQRVAEAVDPLVFPVGQDNSICRCRRSRGPDGCSLKRLHAVARSCEHPGPLRLRSEGHRGQTGQQQCPSRACGNKKSFHDYR